MLTKPVVVLPYDRVEHEAGEILSRWGCTYLWCAAIVLFYACSDVKVSRGKLLTVSYQKLELWRNTDSFAYLFRLCSVAGAVPRSESDYSVYLGVVYLWRRQWLWKLLGRTIMWRSVVLLIDRLIDSLLLSSCYVVVSVYSFVCQSVFLRNPNGKIECFRTNWLNWYGVESRHWNRA